MIITAHDTGYTAPCVNLGLERECFIADVVPRCYLGVLSSAANDDVTVAVLGKDFLGKDFTPYSSSCSSVSKEHYSVQGTPEPRNRAGGELEIGPKKEKGASACVFSQQFSVKSVVTSK